MRLRSDSASCSATSEVVEPSRRPPAHVPSDFDLPLLRSASARSTKRLPS